MAEVEDDEVVEEREDSKAEETKPEEGGADEAAGGVADKGEKGRARSRSPRRGGDDREDCEDDREEEGRGDDRGADHSEDRADRGQGRGGDHERGDADTVEDKGEHQPPEGKGGEGQEEGDERISLASLEDLEDMIQNPSVVTRRSRNVLQTKFEKGRQSAGNVTVDGRYRPGKKALLEIRHYQETTELLITKVSFQRLVRELVQNIQAKKRQEPRNADGPPVEDVRFEPQALQALQEAFEAHLVGLYEDSYLCASHAKRVTLMERDMRLAQRIREGQ